MRLRVRQRGRAGVLSQGQSIRLATPVEKLRTDTRHCEEPLVCPVAPTYTHLSHDSDPGPDSSQRRLHSALAVPNAPTRPETKLSTLTAAYNTLLTHTPSTLTPTPTSSNSAFSRPLLNPDVCSVRCAVGS